MAAQRLGFLQPPTQHAPNPEPKAEKNAPKSLKHANHSEGNLAWVGIQHKAGAPSAPKSNSAPPAVLALPAGSETLACAWGGDLAERDPELQKAWKGFLDFGVIDDSDILCAILWTKSCTTLKPRGTIACKGIIWVS